jgi:flagellin
MNIKNAKDGQSLVDTQEGAMQEVESILQRIRELAVQRTSGVATSADQDYLQLEVGQLVAEIDNIGANTRFQGARLLTGATFSFYTDIDAKGTSIDTVASWVTGAALNITVAVISIGSGTTGVASVAKAISLVDSALGSIASFRANLGAVSNRFDHIIDNLTNVVANTEAAKSRVEDADFAVETTQLTRNTVLQQAATSMVAQANASKNTILALIQG